MQQKKTDSSSYNNSQLLLFRRLSETYPHLKSYIDQESAVVLKMCEDDEATEKKIQTNVAALENLTKAREDLQKEITFPKYAGLQNNNVLPRWYVETAKRRWFY